jgi:Sortilin, neurotensin receptor 3, C-terminal
VQTTLHQPDDTACLQNRRTDVLITIDIKEVLQGKDIKQDSIPPRSKCDAGDYEEWTPADGGAPQCILGSSYTFKRMRPTTRNDPCFLDKDYKAPPTKATVRGPARTDSVCMRLLQCSPPMPWDPAQS